MPFKWWVSMPIAFQAESKFWMCNCACTPCCVKCSTAPNSIGDLHRRECHIHLCTYDLISMAVWPFSSRISNAILCMWCVLQCSEMECLNWNMWYFHGYGMVWDRPYPKRCAPRLLFLLIFFLTVSIPQPVVRTLNGAAWYHIMYIDACTSIGTHGTKKNYQTNQ